MVSSFIYKSSYKVIENNTFISNHKGPLLMYQKKKQNVCFKYLNTGNHFYYDIKGKGSLSFILRLVNLDDDKDYYLLHALLFLA